MTSESNRNTAGRVTEESILEAAEVILERDGFAGLSARSISRESGMSAGLIHYYFGSLDGILERVVGRCADWLIGAQEAAFGTDHPLADKWHLATEPLRTNIGRRRMKVWFEISAMAVNRPDLLRRVVGVNAQWRQIIRDALDVEGISASLAGTPLSVDVMSTMLSVILKGLYWENLQEFHTGHLELLETADAILRAMGRIE